MQIHDQPLSQTKFIALDTETTGLSWRFCQLLEIGAVQFNLRGEATATFEQLIDPGCSIPYAATAVHGITDEMVRGMPCIRSTMPRLLEFISQEDAVLLIHNASFDLGFLRAAADLCGLRLPETPVIDTLQLCRGFLRDMRSHRLDLLAARFCGKSHADHRALGDARVLSRIVLNIIEMHSITEMSQLLERARLKTLCAPMPKPARPRLDLATSQLAPNVR